MILLDTSALLWVVIDSPRLGRHSRELLLEEARVYASPVSIAELVMKQINGKIALPAGFDDVIEEQGLIELALRSDDTVALRDFPELAGHDPFDRMLAAQAQANGMDFLTSDRRLLALGRRNILDATA